MPLFPDDPPHVVDTLEHVNTRALKSGGETRRRREDMASCASSSPTMSYF